MTLANRFQVKKASPTTQEFLALRAKIGWQSMSIDDARSSLNNSLFHVVIYDSSELVGMGRVVGDGVMHFYIQDVVVAPNYQGFGLGAALMNEIESYLSNVAKQGATIGLLAAKGKEAFYERFNYIERPNASLGHGMCKFI